MMLLCIMLAATQLTAQNRTVTGKVTDADGKSVPGASVQVKGTKLGTSANDEGVYSISVPATAKTLVVSAVGLLEQEVRMQI